MSPTSCGGRRSRRPSTGCASATRRSATSPVPAPRGSWWPASSRFRRSAQVAAPAPGRVGALAAARLAAPRAVAVDRGQRQEGHLVALPAAALSPADPPVPARARAPPSRPDPMVRVRRPGGPRRSGQAVAAAAHRRPRAAVRAEPPARPAVRSPRPDPRAPRPPASVLTPAHHVLAPAHHVLAPRAPSPDAAWVERRCRRSERPVPRGGW